MVKGVRFVDLRDAGDPVEAALAYDAQGADELVFLDITASHEARDTMLDVVRRTAEGIYMPLTVGGGIRSVDDVRRLAPCRRRQGLAEHGRPRASRRDPRGGRAVRQPVHRGGDRRATRAGPPDEPPRWGVYTHGGRRPAGRDAIEWAREAVALGAGEILLTSMDRDGTKDGYDLELTRAVSQSRVRPGHRLRAAPARSSISTRAWSRAAPTRRSPPRSSTSAPTRSPRRRRTCASAASRCGARRDRRRAPIRRARPASRPSSRRPTRASS